MVNKLGFKTPCFLSVVALLQGCATTPCVTFDVRNGLDEGSSLFPAGNCIAHEPGKTRFAVVHLAEIVEGDSRTLIYPDAYETNWCKPLPEEIRVKYSFSERLGKWAVVPVKKKAPDNFYMSEIRGVRVVVDSREEPYVEFFMQLSKLTKKWITHTETSLEKRQRELDEALWSVLDRDMTLQPNQEALKQLLLQGARTIQPWMNADWNNPMPESVMIKALKTNNSEAIDLILKFGGYAMWLYEDIGSSQLNQLILAKRYDLLDIFLRNGVNPNFQDKVGVNQKYGDSKYRFGAQEQFDTFYTERPLVIAVMHKDVNAVKVLLKYGADLNFTLDKNGPFGELTFDTFLRQYVSPQLQQIVKNKAREPNLAGVKKADGFAYPNPNLKTRNQVMLESYDLPKKFVSDSVKR